MMGHTQKMNNKTFQLSIIGLTAALYVVLTVGFAPISYMGIQMRLSEVLNLLAFINPIYGVGVILGCLISNFFSPLGIIDVIVGTSATAATIFLITKTKNNLLIASLWPTLFCIPIGLEIGFIEGIPFGVGYLWIILSIMAGEFAVVTCIGYPLFRYILSNRRLYEILKLNPRRL